MKTTKSLARAQRAMRNRQQSPRPTGRPRLPISSLELLELWAGGLFTSRHGNSFRL